MPKNAKPNILVFFFQNILPVSSFRYNALQLQPVPSSRHDYKLTCRSEMSQIFESNRLGESPQHRVSTCRSEDSFFYGLKPDSPRTDCWMNEWMTRQNKRSAYYICSKKKSKSAFCWLLHTNSQIQGFIQLIQSTDSLHRWGDYWNCAVVWLRINYQHKKEAMVTIKV